MGLKKLKISLIACVPIISQQTIQWVTKLFFNPLYKVNAQKDVETTNSFNSKDEKSDNSDRSRNSDYGRLNNLEDLSIHSRTIRERESCQFVRQSFSFSSCLFEYTNLFG